jgi:23S rRNA (uridine2552-2'-O)-methyltransferase
MSEKKTEKGRSGRGASDRLFERVKTAKGRKISSTRWLERQLNDPYVAAAQRQGFRSRAAFKLIEIDERFKFLRRGQKIIDLGAAPGGWSQIAADKIGSAKGHGKVIAIDIQDMSPLPGVDFMLLDFMEDRAPETVMELAGGRVNAVISDMAAPVTGHRNTDHLRTIALAEAAAWFSFDALEKGGMFCAKVFQGGTENDVLRELKARFGSVSHVKPKASRKESVELYVIARDFRG